MEGYPMCPDCTNCFIRKQPPGNPFRRGYVIVPRCHVCDRPEDERCFDEEVEPFDVNAALDAMKERKYEEVEKYGQQPGRA